MLKFKKLDISDKDSIDSYLQIDGAIMASRCFGSLYMWANRYGVEICVQDGVLYGKANNVNGKIPYLLPLGGELEKAIDELELDAKARGMDYYIDGVTEDAKEKLMGTFPDRFVFAPVRDWFDYVYRASDLIELKGKEYHSKRNFINRFKSQYEGRWAYEDVDPVIHRGEMLDFFKAWVDDKDEADIDDYNDEYEAVERLLDGFDTLGGMGGMIRIDGEMKAFTLACPQNSAVVDITTEKADKNIIGLYQLINQQFAEHRCRDYSFINREEDLGIPGIRKAKLSYSPVMLTIKYQATPKCEELANIRAAEV